MKIEKWNVRKAALYGAALSMPYLLGRAWMIDEALPQNWLELTSYAVGGLVGGAFLFAIVAAVRNLFVR
ncbi:MAG: hypothetical protein ACFE0S_09570 [Rhodospirillales bacterium]